MMRAVSTTTTRRRYARLILATRVLKRYSVGLTVILGHGTPFTVIMSLSMMLFPVFEHEQYYVVRYLI